MCSDDYLQGADADFSVSNVWDVAHLGDRLNRVSGVVGNSALHIQDINLKERERLAKGLGNLAYADPSLVSRVIDYHTRWAMPVYRGTTPPTPRARASLTNGANVLTSWGSYGMMFATEGPCVQN